MNVRFQNALNRVEQSIPPIWFMRQAGRYHAHYRRLREKHSFMDLCKDPRLAAQTALGPVEDFDFDLAILFSDILFPLEALGMDLFYADAGPRLGFALDADLLPRLRPAAEALPRLAFQKEALVETRRILPADKSLIGFVGGPFTLFSYAVEGTHAHGLIRTKRALPLFPAFCERLVPLLIANIELQLEGGAEMVMIFDTAAGELSPGLFREAVVPQLSRIFAALGRRVGYYSRGTQPAHLAHPLFTAPGLGGIGVDHRWQLSQAFGLAPRGFVQGNFDEALLHLDAEALRGSVAAFLAPLQSVSPAARAGWVCGLGHGVAPGTPEENVRSFVRIVRELLA